MSIQILHYEFLGPVPLDEWEPPMEEVVYIVLARERDQFRPTYAGVCERTDDRAFFTSMESFKCWIEAAGSERSLYLAILPMFRSGQQMRRHTLGRIVAALKPPCNR